MNVVRLGNLFENAHTGPVLKDPALKLKNSGSYRNLCCPPAINCITFRRFT